MATQNTDGRQPTFTLSDRLQMIKERIKKAAEKSGRSEESVKLIAVGKTVPAETLLALPSLGIFDLAENKVQEAEAKRTILTASALAHHFIGHLQTNKARKAVELFDLIQTVDSLKLAETIERIASEQGKEQRCLVEIKISHETTKTGLPISEAHDFLERFSAYSHLKLEGLMTIAPYGLNERDLRDCFQSFIRFAEKEKKFLGAAPVLSFGMSDDFDIAVEEGSNMVRIGRALFGERTK